MRELINVLIMVALITILAFTFAPLILVVLVIGLIYTIYTRYKISKAIKEEVRIQEEFDRYEEPKENLAVIEAEYEEKTK